MFDNVAYEWGKGYYDAVLNLQSKGTIDFTELVNVDMAGAIFQQTLFYLEKIFTPTEMNIYCFGYTYGLYDVASTMLKSEIEDIFNQAAETKYKTLHRNLILENYIKADFTIFYTQ
jgi:hypothetical protein